MGICENGVHSEVTVHHIARQDVGFVSLSTLLDTLKLVYNQSEVTTGIYQGYSQIQKYSSEWGR